MKETICAAPQERLLWPDALRVVSIFAVMVIHLAATGYSEAAPGSYEWTVCLIFNTVTRFAVPAFVMISGAMYLNPGREIGAAHILKRIGRLMTVFLHWSVPYALVETVKEREPLLLLNVLRRIVTGHYHMWYIYLIAGLYLLTPVLRSVAADRKKLRMVILLAFALSCGAGLLPKEIAENVSTFFCYAGYYCLGYYLYSTNVSKKQIRAVCLASLLLLTVVLVAGSRCGDPKAVFSERMPHIILYSSGVFLTFKGEARRLENRKRFKAVIGKVAPCAFGMYLLHPAFNFIFRRAGLYALSADPLLCVPLCSVLVWAASFAVIFCMRKFALFRRVT